MNRRAEGGYGEDVACRWLQRAGYRIVDRNYHTRYGEVDIIAQKDGVTAFVEVKTRRSERYGRPCEYVDARKQEKLARAAFAYVQEHGVTDMLRFDVAEVFVLDGMVGEVRHIPDAFRPPQWL